MTNFEIRANIKFLTRLNWKPVKIIKALQPVYGESASCRAVVYNWIKHFKEGREQLENDSRKGRPCTSKNQENIRLVQNRVEENRTDTIDKIANAVGISRGSAFSIFTEDLCLSKLSARWVPKALQENQLNQRADLSLSILTKMKQMKPFFLGAASQEMKRGSINLIQKTKFNQKSDIQREHQDLLNLKQKGLLKRSWPPFFETVKESC